MIRTPYLTGLALLLLCQAAFAVIETYDFTDPALQQRYQDLSAELRCPKCQNQNIADSNAPIAKDLRQTLHQQLEQGASDDEILEYMVARYGEFVRYRPRFSGATMLLWLAPALLLLLGIGVVAMTLRRRSDGPAPNTPLSAEEQARLDALVGKAESDS